MKKHTCSLLIAFLACGFAAYGQSNVTSDPAYLAIDKAIDLKTVHPQVDINLPRFLLKDIAPELNSVLSNHDKDKGIDLEELIKDIKLIRVVVIEAKDGNKSAVEKGVKQLRKELEAKWTAIVNVPDENVGVFAMGDPAGENMAGIAVLVHDKEDVVIANIVGRVSIGKLIKLASSMDKVPKDLLKKLQGMSGQGGGESGEKKKSESSAKSPESSDAPAK
jgi:hypothetical protein